MGDLSIDQVSTAPSTDYYDAVKNTCFFPEHSPPSGSSVNGFSFHFVTFTSYLSRRLIRFLEDLVARDVGSWHDSGQHALAPPLCSNYRSTSTSGLADVILCTNQLASGGRETYVEENLRVNTSCEIVESNRSFWNGTSIFQGLLFPLFGFRFAWRLAFTCLRCSFLGVRKTHHRMRSLISRVQRTLRGSSEDIGWLQQMQGMPPVEDGTSRFMELLRSIRNGKHTLPNSMVYLLIPGLFSNHSPLYFVNTKRFFSKMGLACHIAKIHSEASVEQNAWEIKQYIEELYWGSGKRVLLLGHSKGGVDAAAALSIYWSDLREKVSGLALVQSPYGGSPIASDILREGQIADVETRRLMELIICKLIKGDMQALEDLTYDKRKEFISKYELPTELPVVSFHTEASVAPDVLATMLLIAHAELPWLPNIPGFCQEEADSGQVGRKLPVVIPLGAAMAVCALHLQLRYGEKSDGLVTCRDAEVPGSIVVRPDRKLDHAWMVHSAWKKDPNEPDAAEMCEALLTLLVEIGQKKQGITENI